MGKIQKMIISLLVITYQSTLADEDDDCERPLNVPENEFDCNRGKQPLIIEKGSSFLLNSNLLHCYDLFLHIYQNIFIVGGGTCETINVSSEEKDIHSWAKSALGTYKWIGRIKRNNAPLYKLDSTNTTNFMIKEWTKSMDGYNGWKVVVIVT